jgi:phospholipid transport system substrate-binding protein
VSLFTQLLERAYIGEIEGYSGEQIKYGGESVEGDVAEVRSTIVGKRGLETQVVYRVIHSGSEWQVYDLVVDGVSLVNNYRVQFARLIRTEGYAGLVKKMRTKLETEQASERVVVPSSRP